METSTMARYKILFLMVVVRCSLIMGVFIMVIGKTDYLMDMAHSNGLMAKYIEVKWL